MILRKWATRLPEDTYLKMRIHCAKRNIKIESFIMHAIEKYIERYEKYIERQNETTTTI